MPYVALPLVATQSLACLCAWNFWIAVAASAGRMAIVEQRSDESPLQ